MPSSRKAVRACSKRPVVMNVEVLLHLCAAVSPGSARIPPSPNLLSTLYESGTTAARSSVSQGSESLPLSEMRQMFSCLPTAPKRPSRETTPQSEV